MPRSPSTYSLPPGTTPQQPNSVISSSMFNAFADDVAQTFNTVQPIAYGGTGVSDLKLNDTDFGIKDNSDPTKIGQFNASNLPTATTRTYDLPYYSGTLGLVSDIRGQIYGLTLSNNATDLTNDIDIAAGAAVDSTGSVSMVLNSALGKRLDAAWAVGGTPASANGWLDTGAVADGYYNAFLIRRPDTGVVDSIASLSATPLLPTNYTQFRRIGTVIRAGGSNVRFVQDGDYFWFVNLITDVNGAIVGTSPTDYVLSVPRIAGVQAIIQGQGNDSNAWLIEIYAKGLGPGGSFVRGQASFAANFGQAAIRVDSAARITARASTATTVLTIWTKGWIDTRGKD